MCHKRITTLLGEQAKLRLLEQTEPRGRKYSFKRIASLVSKASNYDEYEVNQNAKTKETKSEKINNATPIFANIKAVDS